MESKTKNSDALEEKLQARKRKLNPLSIHSSRFDVFIHDNPDLTSA